MSIEIEFQPLGRKVHIEKGTTALEAAQQAGIGLLSTCGGQASCGSCIIRLPLSDISGEPTETDLKHLSNKEIAAGDRLACRTCLFKSMVITIPPKSLSTKQRLQTEGIETPTFFDPAVRVHDIRLTEFKNNSNHEFCQQLLSSVGIPAVKTPWPPPAFLNRALRIAEKDSGQIRILTRAFAVMSVLPKHTPVLGLAVDVGTTKLAAYLIDLKTGITITKQGISNPQVTWGDDVMTRIAFALKNQTGAATLQAAVIDAINQLASSLCESVNADTGNGNVKPTVKPAHIVEAVLVGNTAMHHICLGLPLEQLGRAPYQPAVFDELDLPADSINLRFSPEAQIHTLPNVAGFVGADHVSMLLAAGIRKETRNTLYVDIGTNTEMTLMLDGRMLSCSTASGPAFEGAHIRNGMRAADGAIEKVQIFNNSVHYKTIGDVRPTGICGSGIIDAIAEMCREKILNQRGAFDPDHPLVRNGDNGPELVITPADKSGYGTEIILNRKDVSEIQLAKGAIRAGLDILLAETDHGPDKIEKVIIAGAFGSFINIKNAIIIGLFPDIATDRFIQIGNAAGIGAKQNLLSLRRRAEASAIAKQLEYVELAGHPGFTGAFAKAMLF